MLLALDVGNTNITLGVYEGEKLLFVTRMATNPPRMEDEYASAMLSILHLYNIHVAGERRGFKLRCAAADR